MLSECPKLSVPAHLALVGVAYAVACQHERGREFLSLAFIAENLVHKAKVGDDTWAFDIPHRINPEVNRAHEFATQVVDALEKFEYGIKANRRHLLSTFCLEALSRMIQDHTWNGVMDAVNHVLTSRLRQSDGHVICGWGWFANYIEPAKAAKAAAAAAAQPRSQPQPQPAATANGPSEGEVEAACEWLRTYLGSTWHNSNSVAAAATREGISHQAYLVATERIGRQKMRGANAQWITAMPGIPPPSADSDDVMGTIRAADYNRLLATKLYRQGAEPLLAYARSQAEKNGCTQDDVIGVILDVLRFASSPENGARQKTLELVIGPNCGFGKPRHDVTHWADFNRLIADGIQRKAKTA